MSGHWRFNAGGLVAELFLFRYCYAMRVVGAAEAAGRLGVTPRRVRQMIASGQLPACRVGRVWAIDEHDVEAAVRRPAHRPWKPASAWAVLAAAEGSLPPSLPAYERHRALKRLEAGLANIVVLLSQRCRRRTFYAHPADADRIVAVPGVVRTAASAADEHGIDLVGPGPAEAYVSGSVFAATSPPASILRSGPSGPTSCCGSSTTLTGRSPPEPWSPRGLSPRSTCLESGDERTRRAGAELLESL